MPYTRPKPDRKISPEKKAAVIREYVEHYRSIFPHDPAALNRKVPHKVLASILDEIGELLVRRSAEIAAGDKGEMSETIEEFLEKNPLPAARQGWSDFW